MKRQIWTRLLLAVLVSATSLTLAGPPSGAVPTDQRSPSASELPGKPIPPPPADAVDPAKGPRTTPKPALDPGAAAPALAPWEVTLQASGQFLWPTRYTTLTATANQDVGPTPFYLSIFDANTETYMAICGSGTTCTVSLTAAVPTNGFYVARVSGWPNANPPPNLQADSQPVAVKWHGPHVELTSSPSTVLTGGSVTLTANVTRTDWTDPLDVGPSPFYIGIYDVATGTRVAVCGTGTSCSATVTQSTEGTRRYVAYVSRYDVAYPPFDILGTSSFARPTWAHARDQRQVSLEVERQTFGVASVRITATTNVALDVSVPYYLEIFDNSSGQLVAICGMGTTCSIVWKRYWFDIGWDSFVAFVTRYSATIPDSPIASSTVADSIYPGNTQHPVP